MRNFNRYNPVQIARYVKTLFRGHLYIKHFGAFEFDYGKILPPKSNDICHYTIMSEINEQIVMLQVDFTF